MHQFSDSDSPDSDDGRRFKTETTRPKSDNSERIYSRYESSSSRNRIGSDRRRRSRSRSPKYDRNKRRDNDRPVRKEEYRSSSKHKEKKEDNRSRLDNNSGKEKNFRRDKKKDDAESARNTDSSLKAGFRNNNGEKNEVVEVKCDSFGPALPPSLVKGEEKSKETKEDVESYGPSLPPNLNNKIEVPDPEDEVSYGPILPPSSSLLDEDKVDVNSALFSVKKEKVIGPDLPPHLREQLAKAGEVAASEDEDDDVIGPLPPEGVQSKAHIALEERALQIKIGNLSGGEAEVKKREEWMMELPAIRHIGLNLGPRQFRANARPDMSDRSSWTDTPEDKLKKQAGGSNQGENLKEEAELKEVKNRDQEQEKIISKHKKKSKREEKSLLQMHQLKRQKQKESEKETERRPFNREIDLKVNHFDEAQKKAILKKAQLLDDRFSSGQAKYL